MKILNWLQAGLCAALLVVAMQQPANAAAARNPANDDTYSADEIVAKAADFFGATTEAVAKAIEKVFAEKGRPNAYIVGTDGGAAIGVGLRYGDGDLYMKRTGNRTTKVYWQGPSIGFDLGVNVSKSFTLVYNLPNPEAIFERFPGVDGSVYVVAGISVNYQQNGRIILAPMRTGAGLRAGVNAGYLSYTRERGLPL